MRNTDFCQDLLLALNETDGFRCAMLEGTFCVFLNVREMSFAILAEVADTLLKEAHIVVTDGEGLGADGFSRLFYATSMENLHRAVAKMKAIFGAKSTASPN